jgi:hypothetical protein
VLQYAPEEQPRSPAAQRPQSEPEQPQTSRLSVAKPNVKKQKVVKREVPIAVKHELRAEVQREPLTAEPTAARRSASMHEIQIAQPPSAPSASAAVARGTSTTANASAPAEVVAQAGQIPSSNPVVAGVRIVAADEFTELDLAANEVKIVSADELNELDLAAGPAVRTDGSNRAEARPMPTPPASSGASALRAVMLGLGAPLVFGFLAWPFLARHRPIFSHLKYRARLDVLPRLRALLDHCAATAATVWTSTKNGSCTRRSIISNVLGG